MENFEQEKNINDESPIYNELLKISNLLPNYFEENIQNILNLIKYFDNVSLEFNNFGNKIIIPNVTLNSKDYSFKNNLAIFYDSQLSFLSKIKQISPSIKKDIIEPLLILKDNYEKEKKDILLSLGDIIKEISKHLNILKDIKQNYYNNFQKLKTIGTEDDINLLENNYYSTYFNEYDMINQIFESSEKNYFKIKEQIFNIENKKNKEIIDKIEIYLKIINDEINYFSNENSQISNKINNYKSNQDSLIISLFKNNDILGKKWVQDIKLESFNVNFNYKNNDNIINNNQNDYNIIKNEDPIINNNYFNYNNNLIYNNQDSIKLEKYFSALKSEKSIDNNFLSEIKEIFRKNKLNYQFYELFLTLFNDSINKSIKEENVNLSLFIFKSFSNLICLTNIINNIIEDIKDNLLSKENNEYYLIFDQIISIGENSVYDNTFMCSLLNKNKIFKNLQIWKNLIFNKIIYSLNNMSNNIISKEDYHLLNFREKIANMALKMKNNMILNNNKNNKIEISGLNNYIVNYNELTEKQKETISEKYSSKIFIEVIKCYLRHMGNYNYILDNPSDIIDIILNDYNIDNLQDNEFYIKYYSVCIYSTKKEKYKNFIDLKKQKLKNKILLIKSKDKLIKEKYPCKLYFNNAVTYNESKFIIIKKVSKFLNFEDCLKLMHINKKYININKIIYKNLLKKKNLSIKNRINIWKSCLKCNFYSSIFNYNQLLSKVNEPQSINENQKMMDQIVKDLKRTKYRYQESPAALFKLLRCFAYSNNKINYYQGMNLVSLFLYELTRNEQEAFIILNNLFFISPFGEIIEDDFKKLKKFYYVIERLIYLFLPRIYSLFKDNQIKVIYFINPYFITLFTNIYVNLPENDLLFLLYVWDNFILNGWKSIFEIILTIFKCLEKHILSLKGDEILSFLTIDLPKNDLFLNKNFEKFCEMKKIFILNNELIDLIEEEVSLEMNIKSLSDSKIIELENSAEKIINK